MSVDGRVIVTSPMDPLFLLLPYVIKAADVGDNLFNFSALNYSFV